MKVPSRVSSALWKAADDDLSGEDYAYSFPMAQGFAVPSRAGVSRIFRKIRDKRTWARRAATWGYHRGGKAQERRARCFCALGPKRSSDVAPRHLAFYFRAAGRATLARE